MKILVVDDEKTLVKGMKFNLESEGYTVDACYDGETAVELARKNDYAVILLDLMMPKLNGLEACQRIREFSTVPVIMLTARSEGADKLMGFESGADDYITKPFDILELKARIRALIRLDPERRRVMRDGEEVDLTAKEFDLIELLMRNPGKVYSREILLDLIWGLSYQGEIRTVDVHIRRLREKLELQPNAPQYNQTKWGVGYYLAED